MKWTRFVRAKSVCAYFFVGPGLMYGLFTSRMPALKEQVQANEAEIGFVLLAFGLSALCGLLSCASLIRRFTSRKVIKYATFLLMFTLPLCGLMTSPLFLGLAVISMGFLTGLVDVAMNAQAIQLEKRFAAPCLALMHGSYSLGGLVGALSSAFFAALGIAPFWNFAIVMAVYMLPRPWAVPRLAKDQVIKEGTKDTRQKKGFALPPLFVILCGLLAACCYSGEGTVGEWGSLYLFSVKGSSEQMAALVYACFSVSTLTCRIFVDMLRTQFTDFPIALCGGLLATTGMCIVLNSPYAPLCLVGYCCMGLGMAPLVPLCFSSAGKCPHVTPEEASAVVSVLGYGGLLACPPFIGMAAHNYGLDKALLIALGLTICMCIGAFLFRERRTARQQ